MNQTLQVGTKVLSLDQQRATIAWKLSSKRKDLPAFKEYRNLVKGAPALIMNSGLIATLAFYQGKSKADEHKFLCEDLMAALQERGYHSDARDYQAFNRALLENDGLAYQAVSREALELLKWFRQFVDALAAVGA